MKKIVVTIADGNNIELANNMVNSLRKFHSEEELPVYVVTGDELQAYLNEDPHFFYRATPILGERFLKEYDLVIKMDADQIVLGDLSYIWSTNYDIGTVLNINRVDPKRYGFVTTASIDPTEYFNCGLVAMRSKDFVNHWKNLCFSQHFGRLQFREQDLLNIICHYGQYKVKCFDYYDEMNNYYAWHGLVSKGETVRAKIIGKDVVIPRGDDGYPDRDVRLKVFHFAGGGNESRNYRLWFNEELINYIDELVKP